MSRQPLRAAALLAAMLALGPAAWAQAPTPYDTARWGLVRLYEPVPGPQRGVDAWILIGDVEKAQADKRPLKTAHVLTFGRGERAGQRAVATVRYDCRNGRARPIGTERFRSGAPPVQEKGRAGFEPIIPHTVDGAAYDLVCGDHPYEGLAVDGVEAAHAAEVAADAAFEAAYGDPVALSAACDKNLLADGDFSRAGAPGPLPPAQIPGWSLTGGTARLVEFNGNKIVAFSGASPGARLTQSGLALAPGDYWVAADVAGEGAPAKLKVSIGRGDQIQAERQTDTVAQDRYPLKLHLTEPADTLSLQAVADKPGETGELFWLYQVCLGPARH
ncbi:hypothetical protein [Caulobacter sp. 17J80-11]|uniref:hypothetical protein n=1 Tax=Caulobacter sp. 17J80-11 TaxID=2763502 RepID=UPI0016535B23|nr:hypothetical protein [Caulobacter sp. 17J80-11]MBC6981288.1 hypothetical protein [Caulobacter sp. 17J80-11]